MVADPDNFEWQPAEPRRNIPVMAWVAIIIGSAAAGVALAQLQPVERLVSAIERNGVVKSPTAEPPIESTPNPERLPSKAAEVAATAPKLVLLNPGTVKDEERLAGEEPGAVQGSEVERAPVRVPTTQAYPMLKRPATPAANRRERKVLVIVRRVVPPYDRRILRGTITDGRLVLDSRDSRGMTIR